MDLRTAIAAIVVSIVVASCGGGGGGGASTPPSPSTVATIATPSAPTPGATSATTAAAPTPGAPATMTLVAVPPDLVCDGVRASEVTARVVDAASEPVADGTTVRFSVVTLATADPINATTTGGVARTSVVGLASQAGIVVNVSAGDVESAIRIDCQ